MTALFQLEIDLEDLDPDMLEADAAHIQDLLLGDFNILSVKPLPPVVIPPSTNLLLAAHSVASSEAQNTNIIN